MKIVALDTGGTTGWAGTTRAGGFIRVGQQVWTPAGLYRWLQEEAPDTVVYEAFKNRAGTIKFDPTMIELIGVVKLYCEWYNAEPIPQDSAVGKSFWTDDKIRFIGLWVPGKRHAMDGLRHLLQHVSKTDQTWIYKLKGLG